MLRSLQSGVSGVKGHQTMLDVVGNNISNVNSVGFKKSRVTFQDLLYQNMRGATAPADNMGGTNPMQIGLGVSVAAIETIQTQGPPQYTGNRTDLAIQGDGYFIVGSGEGTFYTRAGNFVLDGSGNMVQSGTGLQLMGYKMEVDPNDPTRYIAGTDLQGINIPVGQKLEAMATTLVGFRCNLDSRVGSYLPFGFEGENITFNPVINGQEVHISFAEGDTEAGFINVTFETDSPLPFSLPIELIGVDSDGPVFADTTPMTITIGGANYTVTFMGADNLLTITNSDNNVVWQADLSNYFNFATFAAKDNNETSFNFIAEFDPPGDVLHLWGYDGTNLVHYYYDVTMDEEGKFESIALNPHSDDPNDTTNPFYFSFSPSVSSGGYAITFEDPSQPTSEQILLTLSQQLDSTHSAKLDIYDSLGNPHTLEVKWSKIGPNQWSWMAYFPNEPGLSGSSGVISFGPDGKVSGGGTVSMNVDFGAYGADVSTIKLDFSGESLGKDLVDGVTQYGSGFTTKAYYQDGYPMGVLQDFSVGQDGTIVGSYSNGRNKTLYSLPVALFANPQGLVKKGETLFSVSPNSGLPEIVNPQEGGAGSILGGTLEMANVDLTEEFVNLIMAQRGFQANARVITTSDQVLEELMNIKR
ncbi:flagellar hook protein FlgE [Acetomicrobium sp. S15 = DSM 107314]|uniref:flagellar hook protein FlgE n=1 Tax=Acetomicrobium sp. S15 = DSM 107314 TaxID=2529858 RepID=UPI0018E111B2|nr:flagellar hook protein FlgE [Acetomicrobium sp. S15 = DSM 107314]